MLQSILEVWVLQSILEVWVLQSILEVWVLVCPHGRRRCTARGGQGGRGSERARDGGWGGGSGGGKDKAAVGASGRRLWKPDDKRGERR